MNILKSCLSGLMLIWVTHVSAGLSDTFNDLLGSNSASDEILRPEIAFQFFPEISTESTLRVRWQIEPGYYLYRNKINISAKQDVLGEYQLPAGKQKADPAFGDVEVYYSDVEVLIPFKQGLVIPASLDLEIGFQGCKEDSVCYPPISQSYSIDTSNVKVSSSTAQSEQYSVANSMSEQDNVTAALKDKGLLINLISFFVFGLLLALTPCVFPMIPILSGIIVGQKGDINRLQVVLLSISYVLAMALTYAVLGAIAGLFNINLQATAQNPWVLSVFSLIFVLLALSMFDFYEIQIPASLQSRLLSGQNKRSGTLIGAAIMGAISAVIVGPCVAPPLAGVLLYISQTGNAILGGMALFFMGLGFGVPLLIVGATSGELLPRAGQWMEGIKRIFGVIMLGVAIWFLERVIPNNLSLLLWSILFTGTAVFFGAMDQLNNSSSVWQRIKKTGALLILIYGFVLLVAASIGNGSVLKPFKNIGLSGEVEASLPFQQVNSLSNFDAVLKQTAERKQIVMLDFYADWCIACIELEEYTFPVPEVVAALFSFHLVQIDVTANNDEHKAFMQRFELFGPPAILFFDTNGNEIRSHRLIGFLSAEDFVTHINQVQSL